MGLIGNGDLIASLPKRLGACDPRAILQWIASELRPNTQINLMNQIDPAGQVNAESYSEISRRLESSEFQAAQ